MPDEADRNSTVEGQDTVPAAGEAASAPFEGPPAPSSAGTPPEGGQAPGAPPVEAPAASPVEPAAEEKPAPAAGQAPVEAPAVSPVEVPVVGPAGSTLLVRHGLMRTVGQFRHSLEAAPAPGTKVVIRTDRGVELGEVVIAVGPEPSLRCATPDQLGRFLRACAGAYPLRAEGTVLRLANTQDLIDSRHLEGGSHEEASYCRQQIRQLNLPMRLVTVEHTLGGERILFYFSAETRVDFRELVRRLATQYRTRIEMRQVGARDEARIAADYERCGRQCCCQAFLKELQPVSMRMAKTQKATLDPSKISGRCGRLMCCLRYEDLAYEELRKKLPRKNTWVRTAEKVGRVIEGQILTQLVRLALPEGTTVVVPNEEILERDVPAPPLPAAPAMSPRRPPPSLRRPLRDSVPGPEAAAPPPAAAVVPAVAAGPATDRPRAQPAPPPRDLAAVPQADQPDELTPAAASADDGLGEPPAPDAAPAPSPAGGGRPAAGPAPQGASGSPPGAASGGHGRRRRRRHRRR